jgi:hypothetical protein
MGRCRRADRQPDLIQLETAAGLRVALSIVSRLRRSGRVRRRPPAASLLAAAGALALVHAATAAAGALPPQIHTVAGGGSCGGAPASLASGQSCDGIPATSTPIAVARSVSAIPGGGYLFVDNADDLVRQVSSSGTVTTVAGTVETLPNGTVQTDSIDADGIATASGLDDPVSVSALPDGGFLVTEYAGCRVRLVSPGGPGVATITTIAGIPPPNNPSLPQGCTSGSNPYTASTQPQPATSVSLNYPTDAEPTADGGVLIADTYNDAVRYVSAAAPGATMMTIAGGPSGGGLCPDMTPTPDCDGMAAGSVELDQPDSVSPIAGGTGAFLIAEYDGDTVREVSQESPLGTFSTVAGTPESPGYAGDGGPATAAQLNHPEQVASLSAGGFLIADTDNEVIREVSPSGTISTIAGHGFASFSGDGGAASSASLETPASVSPLANGNILIADQDNDRIREVTIPSVSTLTVSPSTPSGGGGWYVLPATVTVSATEKATIQCELDPAQAPAVYGAIAPGCPLLGSGSAISTNGAHMVYAASQNSFGDQERPISLTVKLDVGPPTVTCTTPEPIFPFGDPTAQVDGTLSDSVSGPASEPLTTSADTSSLGPQTTTVSGTNVAGTWGLADCPYFVTPVGLGSMPKASLKLKSSSSYGIVQRFEVSDIPAGATLEVTCKGKGCPFAQRNHVKTKRCRACTGSGARTVNLAPLFAGAELHPGTKVAVSITKPDAIGSYVLFTVSAGKAPAQRTECLAPGATRPGRPCMPKVP